MDDPIKVDFGEIASLNALLDRALAETPVSQFHLAEHLLESRPSERTTPEAAMDFVAAVSMASLIGCRDRNAGSFNQNSLMLFPQ
jgi:hypothetical protein